MNKKKIILFFALLSLLAIGVWSCNKVGKVSPVRSGNELDSTRDEFISNLPNQDIPLSKTVLPNGENAEDYLLKNDPDFLKKFPSGRTTTVITNSSPQGKRNLFIDYMMAVAKNYCDRSRHASINPYQYGFAYSYGSKDTILQVPPSAESACKERVKGLDCSGLVFQAITLAGLPFERIDGGPNAESETDTAYWNRLLANTPGFAKIHMRDFGDIPVKDLQTGDIIYWYKSGWAAEHIGFVDVNQTDISVVQSNGKKSNTCEINKSTKKGPRIVSLSTLLSSSDWFLGYNYGILRLVTDISGNWDFRCRCLGYTTDVFALNLPFDAIPIFNKEVQAYDYNGELRKFFLNFNYNPATNYLGCGFASTLTDGTDYRKDTFNVHLAYDDIPYGIIKTTKIVDNGGCLLDVSLINNEH